MIKEKLKNFTIIDAHLHLGYLSGLNIAQEPDGQIMQQFKKYYLNPELAEKELNSKLQDRIQWYDPIELTILNEIRMSA